MICSCAILMMILIFPPLFWFQGKNLSLFLSISLLTFWGTSLLGARLYWMGKQTTKLFQLCAQLLIGQPPGSHAHLLLLANQEPLAVAMPDTLQFWLVNGRASAQNNFWLTFSTHCGLLYWTPPPCLLWFEEPKHRRECNEICNKWQAECKWT